MLEKAAKSEPFILFGLFPFRQNTGLLSEEDSLFLKEVLQVFSVLVSSTAAFTLQQHRGAFFPKKCLPEEELLSWLFSFMQGYSCPDMKTTIARLLSSFYRFAEINMPRRRSEIAVVLVESFSFSELDYLTRNESNRAMLINTGIVPKLLPNILKNATAGTVFRNVCRVRDPGLQTVIASTPGLLENVCQLLVNICQHVNVAGEMTQRYSALFQGVGLVLEGLALCCAKFPFEAGDGDGNNSSDGNSCSSRSSSECDGCSVHELVNINTDVHKAVAAYNLPCLSMHLLVGRLLRKKVGKLVNNDDVYDMLVLSRSMLLLCLSGKGGKRKEKEPNGGEDDQWLGSVTDEQIYRATEILLDFLKDNYSSAYFIVGILLNLMRTGGELVSKFILTPGNAQKLAEVIPRGPYPMEEESDAETHVTNFHAFVCLLKDLCGYCDTLLCAPHDVQQGLDSELPTAGTSLLTICFDTVMNDRLKDELERIHARLSQIECRPDLYRLLWDGSDKMKSCAAFVKRMYVCVCVCVCMCVCMSVNVFPFRFMCEYRAYWCVCMGLFIHIFLFLSVIFFLL